MNDVCWNSEARQILVYIWELMVKQCSDVFEGLHPTKEIEILVIKQLGNLSTKQGFCRILPTKYGKSAMNVGFRHGGLIENQL